jgi:CheY-like chemotaxis protein
MSDRKVLCVENRPESIAILQYMLENIGYDVMLATSGDQALDMLKERTVDGVLLEYDLPDATGASVRAEMKRIKPDVPVLLFAGVGSQTPFLLRFFDDYLQSAVRPDTAFDDLYT